MTNFDLFKSYDGIITARSIEPSGTPPSVDPAQERYNAIAINTRDAVVLTNHLPKRRISQGARVIPAEVGDPCTIVFNGVDTFLFVMEGIPHIEACP